MAFLWVLFFSSISWANQSSLSTSGKKLKWTTSPVPLAYQSNTTDLSGFVIQSLIAQSLADWNALAATQLTLTSTANNNLVFLQDFSRYGSAVIGLTEVSSIPNGSIQQANIFLNDSYQFVSNPGTTVANQIFLGDLLTHEIGHLLGHSHSEVLSSTMFYSHFAGQSTLGADDRSAHRAKYASGFGKISGRVLGGKSIGVLGAHVQAISRKTGEAIGTISDETGTFEIDGLDLDDTYYLYNSPIKNLASLPGYYSNTQTEFCPAAYVGSFFHPCGRESEGQPQGINLTSFRHQINVGAVTINCSLKTQEDYSYQKLQTIFAPVVIFNYDPVEPQLEKSFVGFFRTPTNDNWQTEEQLIVDLRNFPSSTGPAKTVSLKLIAQPFGNLLEYNLRVERNGSVIAQKGIEATSVNTWNLDLSVTLPLSSVDSENVYTLFIKARRLQSNVVARTYPSFEIFATSASLPHLVVASIGIGGVPLVDTQSSLSDNLSCLDAPFTYAVSKTDTASETKSKKADADIVSCGTIDPPESGSGPGSFLLVCAGFFLAHFLARSKKFLS